MDIVYEKKNLFSKKNNNYNANILCFTKNTLQENIRFYSCIANILLTVNNAFHLHDLTKII